MITTAHYRHGSAFRLRIGCRSSREDHARSGVAVRSRSFVVQTARIVALVVAARGSLEAQSAPPPSQQLCRSCIVAPKLTATLRQLSDSHPFSPRVQIRQNSRGEYIVGPTRDQRRIVVYSRLGEPLRVIDGADTPSRGYGVIETIAIAPNDSVFVFDASAARVSVLSPQFVFVREFLLPARAHEAVLLPGGRLLIQAVLRTPEAFGHPLHLTDANGVLLASFGGDNQIIRPGEERSLYRLIAAVGSDIAAVTHAGRCVVTVWNMEEIQPASMECGVLSPLGFGGGGPGEDVARPPNELRAVVPADDGNLWLVATVAKADWKPTRMLDSTSSHQSVVDRARLHEFVETVVLLIRPSEQRVITWSRVASAFLGQVGPGRVFSRRRTEAGGEAIDIWLLTLQRR